MQGKYLDYLKEEYEKTEKDFESMKSQIMQDIPMADFYQTDETGDTYASRIIKLSNITTRMKTLEENIRVLENFEL